MAKAMGCFTSGSPAKRIPLKPGGQLISRAACSGGRPENFTSSAAAGRSFLSAAKAMEEAARRKRIGVFMNASIFGERMRGGEPEIWPAGGLNRRKTKGRKFLRGVGLASAQL